MTIYCLGSINVDHVHSVPHIPRPGETLASTGYGWGLGGKGLNQAVAAARAGSTVRLLGAIGQGDEWVAERIAGYGIDVAGLRPVPGQVTGQALILLEPGGENAIVITPGANRAQDRAHVRAVLDDAVRGDTLMLQNETDLQAEVAQMARAKGMAVMYSAAPFDPRAVEAVLPHVTALAMNAVEAAQLSEALGMALEELPVAELIVTRGAEGADWRDQQTGETIHAPALPVTAADTTGAGDTFAGFFASARDLGASAEQALHWASRAAALKVTRKGAADAIPTADEVRAFVGG